MPEVYDIVGWGAPAQYKPGNLTGFQLGRGFGNWAVRLVLLLRILLLLLMPFVSYLVLHHAS